MTAQMRRSGTAYRSEASAISREWTPCGNVSWALRGVDDVKTTRWYEGPGRALVRYVAPSWAAFLGASAPAGVAAATAAVTAKRISQRGPKPSMADLHRKSDTGPEHRIYQCLRRLWSEITLVGL